MEYVPQSKLADWRKANTPKVCPISRVRSKSWVVDHDHQTGLIRGVIDAEANVFLGRIENSYKRLSKAKKACSLIDTLKGIVGYLEASETPSRPVMHPVGLTQLTKRFKNNLTAAEQTEELLRLKAKQIDVQACKNGKERASLYRILIKGI
jgi:hypothetical protein